MIKHFNVRLRDKEGGYALTRDNFAIYNNKSGMNSKIKLTDQECNKYMKEAPLCYDINMSYFSKLSKKEFKQEVNGFIESTPFTEIDDLSLYSISGFYVMIIDEYCQAYVGVSDNNIKKRILRHWSDDMPLDRLVCFDVKHSNINIDSFRALDTTRILVYPIEKDKLNDMENMFINMLPQKFLINRTIGGKIDPNTAIANIKLRRFTK